ncbi:MAG: hypothetical protein ACE5D8_02190 [Fidelibacterota bacterium]
MKNIFPIAGLIFLLFSGCTTMSFIPTEGTAAKFNLATTEYVAQANANLTDGFKAEMLAYIDSVLVQDREKLNQLSEALADYEKQLNQLSGKLDTVQTSVMNVSGKVVRDIAAVQSSTNSMEIIVNRLKQDLERSPEESLIILREALDKYIQSNATDQ